MMNDHSTSVSKRSFALAMIVALIAALTSTVSAAADESAATDEVVSPSAREDIFELSFPDDGVLADRDELLEELDDSAGGRIRVIVTARPVSGAAKHDMATQVDRLDGIEDAIAGTGSRVIGKGTVVPFIIVDTTAAGLDAILAQNATGAVELDRTAQPTLTSATAVTGANITDAQQLRGGGDSVANRWETAILDTGIRASHNAFSGRVTAEACFTTDSSCPNGGNAQTGPGSAASYGDSHGTHVASIAAGSEFGSVGGGIAQEAAINAIRVFDSDSGAALSSIVSGIDHVAARELNGAKVASINLSLGIYDLPFSSTCDSFSPATTTAINAARNQGILVLVSAGNDGFRDAVSWPSCISSAVGVANSTDQDLASSTTNIHPTLTSLWAPGSSITAASDTGNNASVTYSGTSMSAPHVAGAVAALADCYGWDAPAADAYPTMDDDILARLIATGDSVTDNRSGGGTTLPRLDLLAAARNLNSNDAFSSPETLFGSSGTDIDFSHCATEEPGEPSSPGVASIWYEWTAPDDGLVTFSTCDAQTTADSVINVYSGATIGNLVELAENDNDGSCGVSPLHSTATVSVDDGQTYRVRLGVSAGSAHGNGVFSLSYSFTSGGGEPTVDAISQTVTETNGNQTIQVVFQLDQPASGTTSVGYTTAEGTATSNSDYSDRSAIVTFSAGEVTKTSSVVIRGDTVPEPTEEFTIELSSPIGLTLGTNATITIEDDDDPASLPTVDAISQTITETNGNQTIQVVFELDQPASGTTRVRMTTTPGTATRNNDYTHRSVVVSFLPGQTSKTANVVIRGGTIPEPTEEFTIALSSPIGLNLGSDATITIIDDD